MRTSRIEDRVEARSHTPLPPLACIALRLWFGKLMAAKFRIEVLDSVAIYFTRVTLEAHRDRAARCRWPMPTAAWMPNRLSYAMSPIVVIRGRSEFKRCGRA